MIGTPALAVQIADHAQGLRRKVIGDDHVVDAPSSLVAERGGRDRHTNRYGSPQHHPQVHRRMPSLRDTLIEVPHGD